LTYKWLSLPKKFSWWQNLVYYENLFFSQVTSGLVWLDTFSFVVSRLEKELLLDPHLNVFFFFGGGGQIFVEKLLSFPMLGPVVSGKYYHRPVCFSPSILLLWFSFLRCRQRLYHTYAVGRKFFVSLFRKFLFRWFLLWKARTILFSITGISKTI